MSVRKQINYIEIPVTDPGQARDFSAALYGRSFEEWDDDYSGVFISSTQQGPSMRSGQIVES